jgi:serine protease Do
MQWRAFYFLVAFFLSAPAYSAAPDSFAPIVEPLMPAVVNISTTQKVSPQTNALPLFDFDGLPDTPQTQQFKQLFKQFNQQLGQPVARDVTSLGSGFVIDPSGYVVTNNHVVGNADQITIIFHDNTKLPATIVGRDSKTDLAVLKVKSDKPLVAVKFGDSDAMRVGDWVIAIGNPFGLGGSVSAGIVSARGRNINAGPFDDFIQTDAAINRGNSGGPLFNTKGEVVGINSAIFSPTGTNIGIGFAVPSVMAKSVVDQLRTGGTIHRGWLGVKIQDVSEEAANSLGLKKARGALVLEISKASPAVGSGLAVGDVVLMFDGQEIDEMRKLPRLVADTKIGKKSTLVVWRNGKEITLTMTIGELPSDKNNPDGVDAADDTGADKAPVPAKKDPVLGMGLAPITETIRQQFDLKPGLKGLVVTEIDPAGEAAKRGIRPGDTILEVNQVAVETIDGLKNALLAAKKSGRDFALLRVGHGSEMVFVTVRIK